LGLLQAGAANLCADPSCKSLATVGAFSLSGGGAALIMGWCVIQTINGHTYPGTCNITGVNVLAPPGSEDSWATTFTKSFFGDFSLKPTGMAGKYGNCVESNRLDNALRSLGAAYGHPDVGNFLGNATLVSSGAAVLNAGANVAFGAKVPALFGDSAHFSTWMRAAWGSAGRLPGRIVSGAGAVLVVGEAAYDTTAMVRCAISD